MAPFLARPVTKRRKQVLSNICIKNGIVGSAPLKLRVVQSLKESQKHSFPLRLLGSCLLCLDKVAEHSKATLKTDDLSL